MLKAVARGSVAWHQREGTRMAKWVKPRDKQGAIAYIRTHLSFPDPLASLLRSLPLDEGEVTAIVPDSASEAEIEHFAWDMRQAVAVHGTQEPGGEAGLARWIADWLMGEGPRYVLVDDAWGMKPLEMSADDPPWAEITGGVCYFLSHGGKRRGRPARIGQRVDLAGHTDPRARPGITGALEHRRFAA